MASVISFAVHLLYVYSISVNPNAEALLTASTTAACFYTLVLVWIQTRFNILISELQRGLFALK